MQMQPWKKVAVGVLGTILLGAFGSGFWDLALKPGGQWLVRASLTGVTLGSSHLKDRVYIETAKGLHEAAATESAFYLLDFKFWFFYLLSFAIFIAILKVKREALADSEIEDETPKSEPRFKRWISTNRIAKLQWLFAIFLVMALLNFGIHSVSFLRLEIVQSAYTYYAQSMRICRPYMTDHDAQVFESRFASIRSRNDYISVTNDLKVIAAANKVRLPDFTPW